MAAITVAWDFTTPEDTSALSSGDDAIRSFKQAIMQRLYNGGHAGKLTGSGSTTDQNDGRHCAGAALAAGASELAGEFVIYAADMTTALATFRDSTAATPSELYLGANKLRTTGTVTSGAITSGAITATGHIKPTTDDLYDLGDATHRWKNAWFSGAVTYDGGVSHGGLETFTAGILVQGNGTSPAFLKLETAQYTSIQTVTTGSTALAATTRVVLGKLVANAVLDLPPAASSTGREVWVTYCTGSFTFSINPNASEQINGSSASYPLAGAPTGAVRGVHIICDGTAWWIITTLTIG